MSERKYQGYWWIPCYNEHQIFGELVFSEKSDSILSLNGIFSDQVGQGIQTYPIIYGCTGDGTRITLIDCYGLEASLRVPGKDFVKKGQIFFGKSKLLCVKIIIGTHVFSEADFTLKKLFCARAQQLVEKISFQLVHFACE